LGDFNELKYQVIKLNGQFCVALQSREASCPNPSDLKRSGSECSTTDATWQKRGSDAKRSGRVEKPVKKQLQGSSPRPLAGEPS
jgi:hypothetical protein